MTSLPTSSPSISFLHRLFRFGNWNSWEVTASSPSFFAPPPERPEKDANRLEKLLEFGQNAREIVPQFHSSPYGLVYILIIIYFYFATF